ncbi:MAG: hypothetical protein JXQ65_02915 [Candidatus Marinimicrobia bacterium]|nr:hypothetical protein [Candidatus Neomarinimicrobiota bacterium]
MSKHGNKFANIGCTTVLLITIVGAILLTLMPREKKAVFEIVREMSPSPNSKVLCVYTNSKNFDEIKTHALHNTTRNSIVIFYYNDKGKIPDLEESGHTIEEYNHRHAIATYKKYGSNREEFLIK